MRSQRIVSDGNHSAVHICDGVGKVVNDSGDHGSDPVSRSTLRDGGAIRSKRCHSIVTQKLEILTVNAANEVDIRLVLVEGERRKWAVRTVGMKLERSNLELGGYIINCTIHAFESI